MRRKPTKVAAAVLAAAVALAIGWYWASPWWTLWRMREAARTGDGAALAAYADFPEISARHRRDFRMWMRSVLEGASDTEEARSFRARAARELARPDSDVFIADADIRPWLAELPVRFAGLGSGTDVNRQRLYVVHYGLDGFEARYSGSDWEMGPLLTFHRNGLGWRLVEVRWGQQ
jgi:hypothetical protein